MRKIIFGIIFLVLVALAVYLLTFRPTFSNNPGNLPTPQPSPIPQEPATPQGWKKYNNTRLQFSFAIPPEFVVEPNGPYSVMAKHPSSVAKTGDIEFFYVSVTPQELVNNETGEVYNYQKFFFDKLQTMEVGEIENFSGNEEQKDWFMYERAGDEIINGRVAKVFINQRPWEFPAGTWEYRYIFDLDKKIVTAGAYFVGGPSDTPLSMPVMQQIMRSLIIQ